MPTPSSTPFDRLAERLGTMPNPSPDGPALRAILTELYAPTEAALVAVMPVAPSTVSELSALAKLPEDQILPLLEGLCHKGLVIDLYSAC